MVSLLQKGGVTMEHSVMMTVWIFLGLCAVIVISQLPKIFHIFHKGHK